MAFEAYVLAVDAELGREFEAGLGESRDSLRRLESAAQVLDLAPRDALLRVVLAVEDAARLDVAWWREVRRRAPQAQLLVLARRCDDEMWRRWTLLGGLGVLRPPFTVSDLEAEFATEPAITAMFRRHPRLGAHGKTMFRYTVPSDPQFIPGIVHVVAILAMEFGFEVADYATNIPLALDEAVSNAIKHGNKRDARKRVEIEGQVDGESLRIKVRDEGEGFERDHTHDPLDPANLLAPNGRGLFLIESLMDDVKYTQDGRCIEMVKRAHPAPTAAKPAKAARGGR